jgi:NADH dehydrogenase FAD-containing subunit
MGHAGMFVAECASIPVIVRRNSGAFRYGAPSRLVEHGTLNVVVVGGDATGVETAGAGGTIQYAKEALETRGVQVRLGERVAAVDSERVTLQSGEEIRARTTVWAEGHHGGKLKLMYPPGGVGREPGNENHMK